MGSYIKYRDEELKKNSKLKEEYDALESEYDINQTKIDARALFDSQMDEEHEKGFDEMEVEKNKPVKSSQTKTLCDL